MSARGLTVALAMLFLGSVAQAQSYLGPETCQACHAEAYAVWKAGPHARAMVSLTGRSAKDGRCLGCHSPQQDKGLAQVSCESCHGPGQFYSPAYVMKDTEVSHAVGLESPGEKACRVCHDASSPSLHPFDYKSKLKLIDHWTAERERRKSLRAQVRVLDEGLGLALLSAPRSSAAR
jgi:hypothetical protein